MGGGNRALNSSFLFSQAVQLLLIDNGTYSSRERRQRSRASLRLALLTAPPPVVEHERAARCVRLRPPGGVLGAAPASAPRTSPKRLVQLQLTGLCVAHCAPHGGGEHIIASVKRSPIIEVSEYSSEYTIV